MGERHDRDFPQRLARFKALGFFRVDKTKDIITELKRSYAIELETMQNYLANSIDLEGADAERIRKSLEEQVTLKLKHARRLAKRINVLGARLPGSLELPRNQNLLQPPLDNADAMAVIRGVMSANEASISSTRRSSTSQRESIT